MITRESVSASFPVRPLAEVAEFLDSRRKPVKESERKPGPYPYYGANGQQGTIDGFIFDEPLILLAEDGGFFDQPDRGIAYRISGKTWVNNHAHVIRPRKGVDLAYLCRVLENYDVTPYISGSTRAKLTKGQAEKIEIPLPPIEEQKRIAAILDQADELRRKRQRALDRLNQLGQAIFIEMFGDFTTNPLGWDTVKLGDICGVGSSKRVFVEEFVDEGVPFYRGTEVGKLATGEAIEPDLFISPSHYAELVEHSGKPNVGDLLLPSICHDGRIWRVDNEEPFYFKDGRVLWIKQNESVLDSEYLRNHLRNAFLRNYLTIASGTTFAELKIVNLKGLSILLPPMKLQTEFSARIRTVEATRIEMVKSERAASLLFNAIQHRAFRGELTASSLKEAAA